MATTVETVTTQPLTAEAAVFASPLESQDLTPVSNSPSDAHSDSQKLETLPQSPPLFLNSIAQLEDLSAAISTFHQCYEDLQNHLDSIKAAIAAKLPSEAPQITQETTTWSPKPYGADELETLTAEATVPPPDSQKLGTIQQLPPPFLNSIAELKDLFSAISAFHHRYGDLCNHLNSIKDAISVKFPSEVPQVTQQTVSSPPKPHMLEESALETRQEEVENSPEPELMGLCKTMCSRGMRKYLATHLGNLSMLGEQVPKALKQAPNPPKLVLECFGKFFLQGSKAFTRNSPMIPAREASILILECFLLMMETDTNITNDDSGVLDIEKAVKEEADAAALAWRKRLVSEGGLAQASQIDARGLLLFVACFGVPALFKAEDIRDLVLAANVKEIVDLLNKSHVLMSKISDIIEGMLKKKTEVEAVDIVYTLGLEKKFNAQAILVSFLRESKGNWKKSRKGSHGSAATVNEANKKQLAALKSVRGCLERHKIDPAKLLPGWQINDRITTLEKDIANSDGKTAVHKRKSSEMGTLPSHNKPQGQEAKRSHYGGGQRKPDSRRNLSNSYPASQPVIYGGPGAGLLPHQSMIPPRGGPAILSTYVGAHADVSAAQLRNRSANPYVWHRDSAIDERYNNANTNYASHSQPPSAGVGLSSLYRVAPASIEAFAGNANTSSLANNAGTASASASDLYHFADSVVESEYSLYPSTVAPAAPPRSGHYLTGYLYQV